jgi:predicted aconitase
MYLTKEEERIYDGEKGWANQVSMKILVKLGELFNAKRLIPIASAHVSGISYKTLGDAPAEFLEALANSGGRVKVEATLNPQSIDPEYLSKKLPRNMIEKQLNIIRQFDKMGFAQSFTCTPYYLKTPNRSSHISWAESSAVIYANSVLGAWTNREGGPSALAAAIIGKTPDYGVHKAENRKPDILVKVEAQLQDEIEYGALGILLGKTLENKIPIIQGLKNASKDYLKQLGAALASTGMTNMFFYKATDTKIGEIQKISVEAKDIKETVESLSTTSEPKPELVFIGCPHCSLNEVQKIANLIGNSKVRDDIEFWICTSRCIKEKNQK